MISFASDNNSGIDTRILKYINDEVNSGHQIGYGDDFWTKKTRKYFKEYFGRNTESYFVTTGTAANVIGLSAFIEPYESIICSKESHLLVDETSAVHRFIGCGLNVIPHYEGKIIVEDIDNIVNNQMEIHNSRPKVITISQATEVESFYTIEEIKQITNYAHNNNMYVHMDGARIANAAVAMDKTIKEITIDCGIDALSFGATKNGCFCAEAVVFFIKDIFEQKVIDRIKDFEYFQKQGLNLISKMRYLSSQFIPYLKNDIWKENAINANNMAKYLEKKLSELSFVEISIPAKTNAVFVKFPNNMVEKIRDKYYFYTLAGGLSRLMCSFNTTKDHIDLFIKELKFVNNY